MVDQQIVASVARGVEDVAAKLEQVRSAIRAAQEHVKVRGEFGPGAISLMRIECQVAQAQGILDALSGWLSPAREGDDV